MESHIKWISETIEEGQGNGVFKEDADPESFGSFLLLMLEGGSAVSKATCSGDVLNKGGVHAKQLIKTLLK